jgi:O-antigen/teichoic acid export membrane protein
MAPNRFLSIPYLLLRSTTAGGGLLAGLIQTFVFARILDPERFSIFILVGTLGVTLWLFDLGMAKVIFVRLRTWFLGERGADADITRFATAIVILYFLLCLIGTVACFAGSHFYFGASAVESLQLALFFLFTAITLVWFAIRNIAVAVDDFIFFESLEAIRRVAHIAVLLATLIGLSLMAFLVIANLIWVVLLAIALRRLAGRDAVTLLLKGFWRNLRQFFRDNRKDVFQTGTYAFNEFYIYTFPYLVVPAVFGLGAPTIILDTAFKVFRGATVLYSAGCDVAVPRQTRAYSEGDRRSLILATLMAAALCSLPCLILVLLLVFASEQFFTILLGGAAVVPRAVSWLLVILLIANLVQTVANFVLVHTGYFNVIARVSVLVSVAMTIVTVIAVVARVDLIGFLQVYTAVYVASALSYLTLAIRGPLRVRPAMPAST